MELDRFLDRLEGVTGGPDQFYGRCPAHDDRSASLSITEGTDGRILLRCHAGCGFSEIVGAMGLEPRHLFPGHEPPVTLAELAAAKQLPVEFLAQHGLHDLPASGVGITYRGLDGRQLVKTRSAPAARQGSRWPPGEPLMAYGLWRLVEFAAGRWLVLVEGESDALTGWLHGLPTIGIPGASTAEQTIDAPMLAGITTILVIQEPDAGGETFVRGVAARLKALGWNGDARVVTVDPDKDLSELHLRVGSAGFAAAFNTAAQRARPIGEVVGAFDASGGEDRSWPDPRPLGTAQAPLPHLAPNSLPASIADSVADSARRLGCPIEFVAVPMVIGLGTIVGRKVCIRPKAQDCWTVVGNLWGAIVSPPGTLKSPAADEGLRPLKALEADYRAEHQAQAPQHELRRIESKVRRADLEATVRDAVKNGQDLAGLRPLAAAALVAVPGPRRLVTSDATIEKLAEVLAQNPNGLLYVRDELSGWLRQFEREGHEADRAFFLESWDGKGDYTVDRIGRGTIHVSANCLSVFGTIQPAVLADYLRAAVRGGANDDGLVQRLQLLITGDEDVWTGIDSPPDAAAYDRTLQVFRNLDRMAPGQFGAIQDDGLPFLRFSGQAQRLFNEWLASLEAKLRDPSVHPALRAHLAKYRSLTPSLALLFHLSDVAGGLVRAGPVSEGALDLAIEWATLLEAHARRLYEGVMNLSSGVARLAEKITRGELRSGFTARDVQRKRWAGLDRDSIDDALDVLEDAGWIRRRSLRTRGRSKVTFEVNPRLGAPTSVAFVSASSGPDAGTAE
jgi:putative DNA primase/helicase